MPLDGAAETWFVKVAEKIYGPYTRELMARYVAEGRVAPKTLVAHTSDGEWIEARNSPTFRAALEEKRPAFKTDNGEPTDLANLIVIIEITSGLSRPLEYELRQMGAVVEIKPSVYLMRTRRTAGAVRNAISQLMGRGDKLIVLDSSRDRLAWFNLGPETDARIRGIWNSAAKA